MTRRLTTEEFIERAYDVHGSTYIYNRVVYRGNRTKIEIGCLEHGYFEQSPSNHLGGNGCPQCSKTALRTTEIFINLAVEVHEDTYIYDEVSYTRSEDKVIIRCVEHGYFEQRAYQHLRGSGCPICGTLSKGEVGIARILDSWNVEYQQEVRFDTCRNNKPLPFDFLVPHCDLLIEYDGIQHFKATSGWNTSERFEYTQHNDAIKNQWAEMNGYYLLRIPYTEFDNLADILSDNIPLDSF